MRTLRFLAVSALIACSATQAAQEPIAGDPGARLRRDAGALHSPTVRHRQRRRSRRTERMAARRRLAIRTRRAARTAARRRRTPPGRAIRADRDSW